MQFLGENTGAGRQARQYMAQQMAQFDPSGSQSASRPQRATVKWFNATKGFGFVTLEDGSDAFCHASALSSLPSAELPQGATVLCDVAQGQRGMQVTHVHR